MAVTVKQRFIHMAPRKLRLVADVVRGKNVETAMLTLRVMPRIAAEPILHALKSASAAAKQQNVVGSLVVHSIFVDEGPALKRRIFKSRGRATKMEHRMSHVTVTLDAPSVTPVKQGKTKKPTTKAEAV